MADLIERMKAATGANVSAKKHADHTTYTVQRTGAPKLDVTVSNALSDIDQLNYVARVAGQPDEQPKEAPKGSDAGAK